jgi:hypothetical protein
LLNILNLPETREERPATFFSGTPNGYPLVWIGQQGLVQE